MVGTGIRLGITPAPRSAHLLEEAESFALACLSTDSGKPEGKIPSRYARTSEINLYEPYLSNRILQQRNSPPRGAGAHIVTYFMQGAALTTPTRGHG